MATKTFILNKCVYCSEHLPSDGEHVFPNGLGGEDVRMDCICQICNSAFSTLEIELLQKSPAALLRSQAGLEGYKNGRNTFRPGNLKFHEIFCYDSKTHIVHESGHYKGGVDYIKSQIFIKEDKFYVDGPSREEIDVLTAAINTWKEKSLSVIVNDGKYKRIVFKQESSEYSFKEENRKKDDYSIELRIVRANYEHLAHFTSRIFVETYKKPKLIVRAKTNEEGIDFVKMLLVFLSVPRTLYLFGSPSDELDVSFATEHDQSKVERCYVKIGLNCLMHYYSEVKHNPLLNNLILYVRKGGININKFEPPKIGGLDGDERPIHYVLFAQSEHALIVTISLFMGKIRFSFVVHELKIMAAGAFSKLEVDYTTRKNTFFKII